MTSASKSDRLLVDASTHFAFGENWSDYARTIDDARIQSAVSNLQRLLGRTTLTGSSVLDIGCGSGIHALAALRLGAGPLMAVDIDLMSVRTCRGVLGRYAAAGQWDCQVASAFDLPARFGGQYDLVYSWGVLHHTGDMWRAVRAAAECVRPGGSFALALYVKTTLCPFWKLEKRLYRKLPRALQLPFIWLYSAIDLGRLLIRGRNPIRWVREYQQRRGMNYWHDAHDWLGGYPYESASAQEVVTFMRGLGFTLVHSFATDSSLGLTGSGCAEYLFRRA